MTRTHHNINTVGFDCTLDCVYYKYHNALHASRKRKKANCHGCKRFQASSIPAPPVGNLPKERSDGNIPFDVIGLDFAGPIIYKGKRRQDCKGYIILYT